MKKILIVLIMLAVTITAGISQVSRVGSIQTGYTRYTMSCTANDTITTSDSTVISITNPQKFFQTQTVTATLETVSGAPSVVITARGRVTSSDSWHPFGTPVTWTSSANNPAVITATTACNYNYLRISFVASGATQKSKILTFVVQNANMFDIPVSAGTLTISRATEGTVTLTSKDNDANAAFTIAAGGTGALTVGDAGSTTAITSSDWAIGATGIATGLGAITADGLITGTAGATLSGAAINLNASSNFATNIGTGTTNAAVTVGGGSNTVAVNSSDWDITTAGVMTGIGAITTDGTFDNITVNAVAGGDKNINSSITQDATALTGTLMGASIVATNGTSAASGTVRGIEAKARAANPSNEGNTVALLQGVYASTDAKDKEATIMRAFEASLDGAAGGTSTEAVAFEAFNNSSATQTSSYAFSANGGTASGHKAYTADLRLQNGETVDNATDGTVAISGVTQAGVRQTAVILNTDASETLTAAHSGKTVIASAAGGATTVTIPDPSAATVGVVYYIVQTADQNLIVTATTANGNSIVCDGVATSDAVTIDTGSHKIGAGMIVIGISATQWYVGGLNPESVLTPEAAD